VRPIASGIGRLKLGSEGSEDIEVFGIRSGQDTLEAIQKKEVSQVLSESGNGVVNRAWFGIRVKPRSEFRASDGLSLRGFEPFLPAQRVRRRWSDRVKVLDEPLFPGYLFCRFEPSELIRILESPGVIQVIGIGRTPVSVSDAEIGAIQTMVASQVVLTPWPYLQTGQGVSIDTGPLAGIQGIVVRSEVGKPRVVVSVTLLQRSVAAEVDREWISLAI
jgi:transcription antitermination factor NusG